jgi:sugar lactone lactonase YvrE
MTAEALVPAASFDRMPSGVAVVGDRVFVSFPRWVEAGEFTVAEVVDGQPVPWPSAAANDLAAGASTLHSVNGVHADRHGRLWVLDNGRIDLAPAARSTPKLVVFDAATGTELFRHTFDDAVAPHDASFLNDVVVSEDHGFAYITESGIGGTPGLIVYDIAADQAWRALDGHESVLPDPGEVMTIDGEVVQLHRPDGPVPWRVAVNAIALSRDGSTLFYGPMTGRTLYGIPTAALRNPAATSESRAAAVFVAADKPITDGIASYDGTIWFTDCEGAGVRAWAEGEAPGLADAFVSDPRMSFPVAIEPTDDALWVTSNQLHRMPLIRAGDDARQPPYFLWRIPLQP